MLKQLLELTMVSRMTPLIKYHKIHLHPKTRTYRL